MTVKKPRKSKAVLGPSADDVAKVAASASEQTAFRSEGQRLLCGVKASLSVIGAATGASSKQTVSDWRSGKKLPSPESRKRIEAAYGIPVAAWTQVPEGASAPPPSPIPVEPSPGESLSSVTEVDDLLKIVRGLRSQPKLTAAETLKIVGEERALLAQRERILERQELLEDRLVREHPEWLRLRDLILSVLTKHPEAARDVARVLGGTE